MNSEADRIVAFLNTRHLPDGDDELTDGRSEAWLQEWLLPALHCGANYGDPATGRDPESAPAVRDLRGLREVREALRELAAANNDQQPDEDVLARGAAALGSLPILVNLGDHRVTPQLRTSDSTATAELALAAVAWSYLVTRLSTDWPRLKACASADCRWVYLDSSRNRSRKWCAMAYCGNQAKARAWRGRRA